jgi:hypothetical protein
MTIDPKVTASQFFKDALKQPDGKAAYAVSAVFVGLAVVGIFAPLLGEPAILQQLREYIWPMLIIPFVFMGCYAGLNMFFDVSAGDRWFNVVFILFVAGVFLWLVIVG